MNDKKLLEEIISERDDLKTKLEASLSQLKNLDNKI
jgi:hypothetical protein